MSRISPDQLPVPVVLSAPPAPPLPAAPPVPPAPPVRRNRAIAAIAIGCVGVLGLGGATFALTRDERDPRTAAPSSSDAPWSSDAPASSEDPWSTEPSIETLPDGTLPPETVPDIGVSVEQVESAYVQLLGVPAAPPTLECLMSQMPSSGAAVRLVRGEVATLEEAQSGFMPFVTCAPDEDFLALMVPATVEVFQGAVDVDCVTSIYLTFGILGRAEARALAYVDQVQFVDRVVMTFTECSV